MNNGTKLIKESIKKKWEKEDNNKSNYLILNLNNGESIFVFPRKVNQEKWSWLEEGKEYNFTVEEGKKGSHLLVDFEIEIKT